MNKPTVKIICLATLWTLGCGAASELPEHAPEPIALDAASDDSGEPPADAAAPAPKPDPHAASYGYRPLWTTTGTDWNHAVAFAPSGDVLSLSAFHLSVHARHDGSVLERKQRACSSIALRGNAIGVRDDGVVMLVCQAAVHEVRLPGLAQREVVKLPWTRIRDRAEASAFGAGKLAVGNEEGEVIEYDTKSWKEIARYQLSDGERMESMAYAPDGKRLAVSRREHGVVLIEGGKVRDLQGMPYHSGALAFSPDGAEVFGNVGSFRAARVALSAGAQRGQVKVSSWLHTARFVDGGLIAASGAHGVGLFPLADDRGVVELTTKTGEGLAVSPDGSMICAGFRSAPVRCWARGEVPPSSYQPAKPPTVAKPTPGSSPTSSPAKPAASTPALAGTLRARQGNKLVVELSSAASTPAVGAKGSLSKKIDKQLGNMSFTAWLSVARVTVAAVQGQRVTLTIDEELSVVKMSGRKVDHFTAGSAVKLRLQ